MGCVQLALQTTCYSTRTVLECCERDKPFLLCLSVVLSNFLTAHINRTKHASFAPKDAFVVATLLVVAVLACVRLVLLREYK